MRRLADSLRLHRLRYSPPQPCRSRPVLASSDGVSDVVTLSCNFADSLFFHRTDIRKPATRKAQIQRPVNSHSASPTQSPSETASGDTADLTGYTEPVSDDEEGDENHHHAMTNDEAGWVDLPAQAAAEAKAYRDSNAGKLDASVPNKAAAKLQEIFPKLTPANLSKLLDSKYETERDRGLNEAAAEGQDTLNPSGISLRPGRIEYVSSFRAQAGKRIAIPVRVEPKVFYANERTSESLSTLLFFSSPDHALRSSLVGRVQRRCQCHRNRNPVLRRPSRYVSLPFSSPSLS